MVCLIWGTTYLGIRISLESMPPALMGGLRWTIAGALLASYVALRGHQLPPPSRWGGILLLGFLLLGLGNGGVVVAEQWVPSGLAAVLVACSPFWMAAVEACLPDGDRLRGKVVAGLLIGFAGILVLVWPDLKLGGNANRGFLAGVIALQIAAFGWSLGSAYSRRHGRSDNVLGTTAYQMLAGGLMMIVAGTVAWRVGTPVLHASHDGRAGVYVDHRRDRRIRRLHLCAAASAGVVRVALRLYQPGHSRCARRAFSRRALRPEDGCSRGTRVRRCGRRQVEGLSLGRDREGRRTRDGARVSDVTRSSLNSSSVSQYHPPDVASSFNR